MYRLLVIIEKGKQSYGAYSPDLPGCVAVGDTTDSQQYESQLPPGAQFAVDEMELALVI